MKKLIVAKFGGSLLSSGESYRRAAGEVERLLSRGSSVVVVVSAMKGVTDELLELAEPKPTWQARVKALMKMHYEAAKEAVGGYELLSARLLGDLSRLFDELIKLVWAVNVAGESTPRSKAAIAYFGERLSSTIMAYALRAHGLEAEPIDAYRLGLIAEGDPLEASVDYRSSEARVRESLKPLIASGRIPVVAGFGALSRSGSIALLGRGGSDYTATIIARSLNADEVILYTDVPGVMTADPKLAEKARVVPRLSFKEAMELALLGAKRFHPRTFEPLAGTGVKVVITSIGSREATTVYEESGGPPLKSVVVSHGLELVKVEGGGLVGRIGTAARVMGAAASLGINIIAILQPVTETSIGVVVSGGEGARLAERLRVELRGIANRVSLEKVSAVSVVGDGMDEVMVSRLLARAGASGRVKGVIWPPGGSILVVLARPEDAQAIALSLHEEVLAGFREGGEGG